MIFYETSAKSNINLDSAFKELVAKVLVRKDTLKKLIFDGGELKYDKKGNMTYQKGVKLE